MTVVKNFKVRGWFIRNIKKKKLRPGRYEYSGEVWSKASVTSPIIGQYGFFNIRAKTLADLKTHFSYHNFDLYVHKLRTKNYKNDLLVLFTDSNKQKRGRLIIAMGILNKLRSVNVKYSQLSRNYIKNMRNETAKRIMKRFHMTMYSESDIKKYRR